MDTFNFSKTHPDRLGWQGEQLLVEQTIYPTINDVTVSNILDLLWDIVSVTGALVRHLSHY
jgi:hypothetical protein